MNNNLKNIAVDLTPILPGGLNGGAKIFVLNLLDTLASIAPHTQFVLLTQTSSHEELASLDRPNMRRLNVAVKQNNSNVLLRNLNVDLLFCPFTAPTYFEPGIPTVCTIYDLQYKTYPEFFSDQDIVQRDRTFIEACTLATMLAPISEYSRISAIKHGEIDTSKIRTIHLRMAQRIVTGVEGEKDALARLGLTPKRYLLYPANFWKHKNHEMLFTAFGLACREGLPADVKLVCTGALGARRDWLMKAIEAMSLEDRVIFPGYVSNAELAILMENCNGLVFPSLYEGFGMPIIEAMAMGVPVACSNTTSLLEVGGDAVIFFDPRIPSQIAQAIVSLVNDDKLHARLIQSGWKRAEEFSDSERMAREYWDLFQLAMDTHESRQTQTLKGWAYEARAEASSLREQNVSAQEQVQTLTAWVHEARAEASLLLEQNVSAQEQIQTLTAWVHEARAEASSLLEQNVSAQEQVQTLTKWVHEARTEITLLREKNIEARE